MKRIGITLSPSAYTPEAYAYEQYLTQQGWQVQLDYELDPNNDINIYFMGMRPFWNKYTGRAIEIHEYQSLSTPPYAKIKNHMKAMINCKPNGRIFLNDIVRNEFSFSDNIPYICRDMGVDSIFFQKPNENPDFDIIYCGSVDGRVGLVDILVKLAQKYKVIVVGQVSSEVAQIFKRADIVMTGRMDRKDLPELYRNARFGLNYTPDIYPFNIQTSTKTLEYLASGLHVISNRYNWSNNFFENIKYNPIWIEQENQVVVNKVKVDVSNFSWENILDKSKLHDFLIRFV